MMEVQSTFRAVEILQTSATVAAIALALATLMQDEGPVIEDVRLIPVTLLLAGFVAVISSGFALGALYDEIGLTIGDLTDVRRKHSSRRQSVIIVTWAFIILGVGYCWVLIDVAP